MLNKSAECYKDVLDPTCSHFPAFPKIVLFEHSIIAITCCCCSSGQLLPCSSTCLLITWGKKEEQRIWL